MARNYVDAVPSDAVLISYKDFDLRPIYYLTRSGDVYTEAYTQQLANGNTRQFPPTKHTPSLCNKYLAVKLRCNNGKPITAKIHILVASHFVPNLNPELHKLVCHRNGVTTDNDESNLYWGTGDQNIMDDFSNKARQVGESGFIGIVYRKDRRKWMVQLRTGSKKKYLAMLDSKIEAAKLYDSSVLIADVERVRNFPTCSLEDLDKLTEDNYRQYLNPILL